MESYSQQLLEEINRTRVDNEALRCEIDDMRLQPQTPLTPGPTPTQSRGRDPTPREDFGSSFVSRPRGPVASSRASSVNSDNGLMGASAPTPYLRRWDPNGSNVYGLAPQQSHNEEAAGRIVCASFPPVPGGVLSYRAAAPWATYEWHLYDEARKQPVGEPLAEGKEITIKESSVFQRLCCKSQSGVAVCRYRVCATVRPSVAASTAIVAAATTKGIRAFALNKGDGIHMLISNKGVKVVQKGDIVVCSLRWRHKPVLELSPEPAATLYCLAERKKSSRVEFPVEHGFLLPTDTAHRDGLLGTFLFFVVLAAYGGEKWAEKGTIKPDLLRAVAMTVKASLEDQREAPEMAPVSDSSGYHAYAADTFLHGVATARF